MRVSPWFSHPHSQLVCIVQVDDIGLFTISTDEQTEEICDHGDKQQSVLSKRTIRHLSKRTTARFNKYHRRPKASILARASFTFSKPLRHLNSKNSIWILSTGLFLYFLGSNGETPEFSDAAANLDPFSLLWRSFFEDSSLFSSVMKRLLPLTNQTHLRTPKNNDEESFPLFSSASFLHENPILNTEKRSIIPAKS